MTVKGSHSILQHTHDAVEAFHNIHGSRLHDWHLVKVTETSLSIMEKPNLSDVPQQEVKPTALDRAGKPLTTNDEYSNNDCSLVHCGGKAWAVSRARQAIAWGRARRGKPLSWHKEHVFLGRLGPLS